MRTLVVGYGNVTRSDDGVGVEVARRLEQENFPDLEVRTSQQLHVELLEDFDRFDRVVLVDVQAGGDRVTLEQVKETPEAQIVSSHALVPAVLLGLASRLGYAKPELYLCKIPGGDFKFGGTLSQNVNQLAQEALGLIRKLLAAA
ncbi:MAG: hydrogenase maturation protease [Verrucomicrobia bacterium]|nr:hydrogenase maturation protease [Verrucomicrobiota bacterium]